MALKFMKKVDGAMVTTAAMIHVELPYAYFDNDLAEIVGDKVQTIGVFRFKVYQDSTDDQPEKMFMSLPTAIFMAPSDITEERDSDGNLRRILVFTTGDLFIQSTLLVQSSAFVSAFFKQILYGHIPNFVSYEQIPELLKESCRLNKVAVKTAEPVIELMIAELNRSPKDPRNAFRIDLKNNPKLDTRTAQRINIKSLGRLSNTFAAMSAEDPKAGITASVNRERDGETQSESIVERVLDDL